MIHNDPSRIPNTSFPQQFTPMKRAQQAPPPAFPRSGWADGNALTRSLQDAINRMRHDYSEYFNWRRPSDFSVSPQPGPPMAQPMYGMPNPGGGGGFPLPNPSPPVAQPMYGMPNPGGGGGITLPDPSPPVASPMYGMPNPSPGRGFTPLPNPSPPTMMPMYGMPNPGSGGVGFNPLPNPSPPTMMPMYGMPNP